MYRVVLIDDENIIVEGLRRVVDWEKHNCSVVGTANSAAEGAEMIRSLKPHILLMDICMPGQDGLSMLAGLRSEFPNMQVSVLTGFRDITFAQQAMRLGVARFLLKPSRMDELQEALQAMTENLDRLEAPPKEAADHSAGSFIVNRAIAFMQENYARHLTLQDVAECCYVSQWHLSKLLNRNGEGSFYEILNSIRIARAKELLADPKLRIGEISEMVGYADVAHFARVFKRIEGISANEYRNRMK